MKASPLHLNFLLPFNLFLLLLLIMNHLRQGDGTKKSFENIAMKTASENTEDDIEIIIHDDSEIHHKEEKEHHSNYSFIRSQYLFSHLIRVASFYL